MFAMYLQVDIMQTFLYLLEDAGSVQFWLMFLICEVASCFKNSGAKDWFMYKMRLRNSSPYANEAMVEHLLKKGGIDSTSEVFAALIACVLYTSEVFFSDHGSNAKYLLTYENKTFVANKCSVSCVGSHVATGPPIQPKSLSDAMWTFIFVLFLRMFFMSLERALLRREHFKFKKSKENNQGDGNQDDGNQNDGNQNDRIALAARNANPMHDNSSVTTASNTVMGVLDVSGGCFLSYSYSFILTLSTDRF